jgi:hypothetical protein
MVWKARANEGTEVQSDSGMAVHWISMAK